MEDKQTLESLSNIIRDYANDDAIIDLNTLIENDLGITGDDAYDLIKKISKAFKVDVSKFEFDKYFAPEPSFFGPVIVNNRDRELSVGDLLEAIKKGKLIG